MVSSPSRPAERRCAPPIPLISQAFGPRIRPRVAVVPAAARGARRLRVPLPPAHEALRQQGEALRQLRVARQRRPVVVAVAAGVQRCR